MKVLKNLFLAAIGIVVVIVILGVIGSSHSTGPVTADPSGTGQSAATTASDNSDTSTDPAAPPVPADEQQLSDIVAKYIDAYNRAGNDMAKGAVRHERAKAICQAFPSFTVSDWVGKVSTLDSTDKGNGILVLSIDQNITIGTTNNEFSDSLFNTLIPVNSPLFTAVSAMKVGDLVDFSGSFVGGDSAIDNDCFSEQSLTTDGSMQNPAFYFKFSSVKEANSVQQ